MITEVMDPIQKLNKELREATSGLAPEHVRYLVDYYYQIQRDRVRSLTQMRTREQDTPDEPGIIMDWLAGNTQAFENNIRNALKVYGNAHPVGRWALGIGGIGPVLAAGLLCHINIEKAPTVGHIWRFAGLDPTLPRPTKGVKNQWNRRLKTLCWKIGESFVKVANLVNMLDGPFAGKSALLGFDEEAQLRYFRISALLASTDVDAPYSIEGLAVDGKKVPEYRLFGPIQYEYACPYALVYTQRKALEAERNEQGLFAEQAKQKLTDTNIGKDTEAYKWYSSGKLPPAHIHSRSKRYAVKLFLAHWHHVAHEVHYGTPPPMPYILTKPEHTHYIAPPNWPA